MFSQQLVSPPKYWGEWKGPHKWTPAFSYRSGSTHHEISAPQTAKRWVFVSVNGLHGFTSATCEYSYRLQNQMHWLLFDSNMSPTGSCFEHLFSSWWPYLGMWWDFQGLEPGAGRSRSTVSLGSLHPGSWPTLLWTVSVSCSSHHAWDSVLFLLEWTEISKSWAKINLFFLTFFLSGIFGHVGANLTNIYPSLTLWLQAAYTLFWLHFFRKNHSNVLN